MTVNGNNNYKGSSPKAGDGLAVVAERFPTPQAHDHLKGYANCHGFTNPDLNDYVVQYPTPCATDHKGAGRNGVLRDRLDYAVERGATKSHTFPTPRTNGLCGGTGNFNQIASNPDLTPDEKRSMQSGNGGRLNPDWVEWLMAFPIGYTDPQTPNHRLFSLDCSHDYADNALLSNLTRLTLRRTDRTNRLKAIGNAQFPPTAYSAFEWGFQILSFLLAKEKQ